MTADWSAALDTVEREACGDAPVDTRAHDLDAALAHLRDAQRYDETGTRWLMVYHLAHAAESLERAGLHELAARCWEDGDLDRLCDDAMRVRL